MHSFPLYLFVSICIYLYLFVSIVIYVLLPNPSPMHGECVLLLCAKHERWHHPTTTPTPDLSVQGPTGAIW